MVITQIYQMAVIIYLTCILGVSMYQIEVSFHKGPAHSAVPCYLA